MEVMKFETMDMIALISNETKCPAYKKINQKSNKFCRECCSPLSDKCPCGKPVQFGHKPVDVDSGKNASVSEPHT